MLFVMRPRTPALLGLLALGATLLTGCPRELQPPPPGDATPCTTNEDCNGGRECGLLSLCVGGFCEATPSLAVPCPGDGRPLPVAPPSSDEADPG